MTIDSQVRVLQEICGEEIVKAVLSKLAAMELQKCKRSLLNLEEELLGFEKRFGRTSKNAWEAYRQSKLGDSPDFMEWMALFENRLALEASCEQLRKTIES